MSAASARFSSSRRSTRSMKDLSRSPATPPRSAIYRSPDATELVLVTGARRRPLLCRRRFLLVLRLPLIVRHAVDDLARLRIRHSDAALLGCLAIPLREAIAAEAREIHEVEILHVGARAQMLDQLAKSGGFELGT